MTDVNEQSSSTGIATETASARHTKPLRQRISTPTWRLRPKLKQITVVKTIKTQIIPRIVLALRKAPAPKQMEAEHTPLGVVERFALLTLADCDEAPFAHVEDLLAQGVSVESIFLDLLAPAARHLGRLWESDTTDFVTITLALGRLQWIVRRLGERFCDERHEAAAGSGETVLLTIIPGEQHSFGLLMVAEFFRRAGWNLCTGPFSSHQELTSLVHDRWFDIVGFSVSSDRRLDELKKDIQEIRRDSRNRHVGIILGGPMVIAHPSLVASMGADMMSTDATTAPQEAHGLIVRLNDRN